MSYSSNSNYQSNNSVNYETRSGAYLPMKKLVSPMSVCRRTCITMGKCTCR